MMRSVISSSLHGAVARKRRSVAGLFAGGDEGGLYILSPSYMYTDTAGTINVTAQDDVVGNITDNSGNGNTLVAVSDAARSLAKTDGTNWWIQLDKVDDNYSTTFASPIVGTMLIGTRLGTVHIEVNIPAGAWTLTPTPAHFPGNTITDIILKDGYMTDAELANAKAWLASRGSPVIFAPTGTILASGLRWRMDLLVILASNWNTSAVTSFYAFAAGCTNLTALDVSGWNTAAATTFQSFAANCTNLTALDVSDWNTAASTTFQSFVYSCINLTTVIIAGGAGNPFADSLCINYTTAFTNTNLTQQSIDNILVAINTAGTSGGTFDQSGGSAPSATGNAAIDALRVRGWTITVTGGY